MEPSLVFIFVRAMSISWGLRDDNWADLRTKSVRLSIMRKCILLMTKNSAGMHAVTCISKCPRSGIPFIAFFKMAQSPRI
jgi:hypothetical protein